LTGLLVELLLPVTLSATLLLVVAGHVAVWDLHTVLGLTVFGVLLVAISLFVSVRVDVFTLPRRRKRGAAQLLNAANPWARLVKFTLGGVVIPLAAFLAANRVELPNHRTPMALAIEAETAAPAPSGAARLGNAVVHTASPEAKVEGIRALQGLGSDDALRQLVRILTDDPTVLQDPPERQALAKALASYGERAEPRLLQLLRDLPAHRRRSAAAPPGELFARYFAGGFEAVTRELTRGDGDPATRTEALARLHLAQAELQRTLGLVEADTGAAGSTGLPAFIMGALLEMDLEHDAELLAFARATAADASWSDAVRGQAMLLIAKLGGAGDLEGLYAYVGTPSGELQARAMQAIGELEAKVSAAAKK
jgi:hypothetical protein